MVHYHQLQNFYFDNCASHSKCNLRESPIPLNNLQVLEVQILLGNGVCIRVIKQINVSAKTIYRQMTGAEE